jgi:hypothetical protein
MFESVLPWIGLTQRHHGGTKRLFTSINISVGRPGGADNTIRLRALRPIIGSL